MSDAPEVEQPVSPYAGNLDLAQQPEREPEPMPPGWHLTEGTLRYYDGENWTDHIAPPPPQGLSWPIANSVFLGVMAALFVVWLGAQIAPDSIYLPVKFVVEELPAGFR